MWITKFWSYIKPSNLRPSFPVTDTHPTPQFNLKISSHLTPTNRVNLAEADVTQQPFATRRISVKIHTHIKLGEKQNQKSLICSQFSTKHMHIITLYIIDCKFLNLRQVCFWPLTSPTVNWYPKRIDLKKQFSFSLSSI